MGINSETFKGERALVLSTSEYRVVVLPERGAKIASIVYSPEPLELLWQSSEFIEKACPSVGYTAEDSCGFDDMFPSILSETYQWETGEKTEINDHGNVWYRKWACSSVSDSTCECTVLIPEFSCTLKKTIEIVEGKIRITYSLSNESSLPFRGLWAAHALFTIRPGMYIQVPSDLSEIINAMATSALGSDSFGKKLPYPVPSKEIGNISRLEPSLGVCSKYYFSTPCKTGECLLIDPAKGLSIRIGFDPEKTPYLGIWINEEGWAGQKNIGIEPATSGMDSPSMAEQFGMVTSFPSHATVTWSLDIGVTRL